MSRHFTELPRAVLVGNGVLSELGSFIENLGSFRKLLIVSGKNVRASLQNSVDDSFGKIGFSYEWSLVQTPNMHNVEAVEEELSDREFDLIIGLGGGKSVDVAKLVSYRVGLPFVSVPTSASHDGVASPFASIKGLERPYSLVARPPIGVLADIDVISNAPSRLLPSGCGDLVAKITAFKDWELGRDEAGEYFGMYAANLAHMSAGIVVNGRSNREGTRQENTRNIMEALISAGVAAGVAGSSRPCSGSEHLFCHASDLLQPGDGLHGERCGLGTIMMAKLHGLDWNMIIDALNRVGAPTRADEISLSEDVVVEALLMAPKLRPERHTILHKIQLNRETALDLARSTGIL